MKRRFTYTAGLKLKVIKCAEEVGNGAAGAKYSVSETSIRRWRSMKSKLSECKKTKKSFSGPRKGRFPEIDSSVLSFFTEHRSKGFPVSRKALMLKAKEVANNNGICFKGSRGWCEKFMKRESLSIRRRTTVCQKMPADFAEKISEYQTYVKKLHNKNNYELSQIGNADETPIFLDMPRNYTVNVKGEKQVIVKTTGNEKKRITVMLCVTADGGKLPPYVILNRKTIPKETFYEDVIVRAQKNAWMTSELMEDWLECVWDRRPKSSANIDDRSMLILDAFRAHLTDDVKARIAEGDNDLVVIPGGLTSKLQSLDVCINKPFKGHVQEQYDEWLMIDNHPLTPAGKIKKPSASTVVEWVSKAWNLIPPELVKKSFEKCHAIVTDGNTTKEDSQHEG